jgi:hypothetical protein
MANEVNDGMSLLIISAAIETEDEIGAAVPFLRLRVREKAEFKDGREARGLSTMREF